MSDNTSVIDVSALDNLMEVMEVDPSANAFDRSKPISDDRYRATIGLPTDEKARKDMINQYPVTTGPNAGSTIISVTAEIVIQEFLNPQKDAKYLQGKQRKFQKRFSSITRMIDGKPTSELATALVAMGASISGQVKVADIVRAFVQLVSAGAVIGVETQWEAQVETDKKRKNDPEKNEWKTIRRGEKNFPPDPAGGFSPDIIVDGKQARARAEIVSVFKIA